MSICREHIPVMEYLMRNFGLTKTLFNAQIIKIVNFIRMTLSNRGGMMEIRLSLYTKSFISMRYLLVRKGPISLV